MAEKRVSAKELRALPATELTAQLQALQREIWQLRVKARDGALQQTHLVRALRRQAARVQTVLRGQSA